MKEFNLKQALAGEPVTLRDGFKAFVIGRIPEGFKNALGGENASPLRGFSVKEGNVIVHPSLSWGTDGNYLNEDISGYDIIGMWEEPKISIEDLPKPFKPKDGEPYFYIYGGVIECESEFWDTNSFDIAAAERGGCFRTKEDAQKWLDFMKSMME